MPLILDGTKGETFPTWTTGTRPSTPSQGQTGYNTTLNTLETYNGTSWIGVGAGGYAPAFRAYSNAAQTVTSGTETKVAINTKTGTGYYDTASCFDTTNNRFTPTIAGYYQINGLLRCAGATTLTAMYCVLYVNGAAFTYGITIQASLTNVAQQVNVSDVIYFNGSSDYVELYGAVFGTGTLSFVYSSAVISSKLSGALVRSA